MKTEHSENTSSSRNSISSNIDAICDVILDVASSAKTLQEALNAFSDFCSKTTGITPGPSFDGWSEDTLLESGVAINPQAAAHCAHDYQRSAVFIRGVYAAICDLRSLAIDGPLEILYAGCGPFATLLLPILGKFPKGALNITLLDIHQRSLDSAERLLQVLGHGGHELTTVLADASVYKHEKALHLVIAETMQKSLEQEPQFAVTANLATQLLPDGVFIPQRIDVSLELADLDSEKSLADMTHRSRCCMGKVLSVSPENAFALYQSAQLCQHTKALAPKVVEIPCVDNIEALSPALFTRIKVYERFCLGDYEAEITLPSRCYELEPLVGGERYSVSYHLGTYPKLNFEKLSRDTAKSV